MNNIDVAKIMADITCDVEKRYSEAEIEKRQRELYDYNSGKKSYYEINGAICNITNEMAHINGELCHVIKSRNHLIAGEVAEMHKRAGIPWRTPSYEWRNPILRYPLKFISKFISKLNRSITVQQEDMNNNYTKSIELLQESVLATADWSRDVETRLNDLTQAVKSLAESVNNHKEVFEYQDGKMDYVSKLVHDITDVDMTDKMYLDFEAKYRGSIEDTEKKQKYYIDRYITGKINPDGPGMIVDLGCGRGEWLTLLKKNGLEGVGVDLNKESLKCCEAEAIKTVNMDIIAYLKTLPADSVKLLTSFQLVEHISTNSLIELFSQIGRVMKKNGVIIIETPNPENVNVGAGAFYLDPTHKRQIHPELMRFLAEENGFGNTEIAYWQQEDIDRWWDSVWKQDGTDIKNSTMYCAVEGALKKSVWCSADYALVAVK